MANPAAASVLRTNPLFRGLPEAVIGQVAELCRNRRYRRGETVFEEGAAGDKLYGLIAGRLLITTASRDGDELHLNLIKPGEIIGEIAFLDGGPRTASARAAEAATCFEVERAAFLELLARTPQLSTHLLQLVCARVRWMTKLAADSAFLSVSDRLAVRLLDLAVRDPRTALTEVRISQAELAQFLGVSRQVVNGYLRSWERTGRVHLRRGAIQINDLNAG